MQPKHHPIEKENPLPNLHFLGSMLICQGVSSYSTYTRQFNGPMDTAETMDTTPRFAGFPPYASYRARRKSPTFSAVRGAFFDSQAVELLSQWPLIAARGGGGTQNQSNVANGQGGEVLVLGPLAKSCTSFFKVTFWFPKWRSLKPWKGHLWVQTRSLWRTW